MSASKEKRTQPAEAAQLAAEREQKRLKEERADRRRTLFYTTVVALVGVAAACLLVWNSGLIQRNVTAVTINGEKYTAAQVQYYYNTVRNQTMSTYYSFLGTYPFDTTIPLEDQFYDEASGQSWYDYFMEQAIDTMISEAAMVDKANEEGFTLSDHAKEDLEASLAELETAWVGSGYTSRDAYLRASLGPYITYNALAELFEKQILASEYAASIQQGFSYTDEEYEAYYQENADSLDTFTYTFYTLQARVETTDGDGNSLNLTEEEEAAALAELKEELKAKGEELKEKLEEGEDPEALAEEYADDLLNHQISVSNPGSAVSTYYSEWMYDTARKNGDTTLAEYENDLTYNCYVVRFENRERDETPIRSVRHILAQASDGAAEAAQEELDAAKARAEEVLAEWEAGEASEETFAHLAMHHSDDEGSASSGGLISNITEDSNYVEAFKTWALDSARKDGDTGLVQTEYGWHIMYYIDGDPTWKSTADSTLRNEDYAQWSEEVVAGYEAAEGFGMNFVNS